MPSPSSASWIERSATIEDQTDKGRALVCEQTIQLRIGAPGVADVLRHHVLQERHSAQLVVIGLKERGVQLIAIRNPLPDRVIFNAV